MKIEDFEFVLLDVETCHFEDPQVIELAGLRWSYKKPIKAHHFKETFIDPGRKIDPASQAVHHISNRDIEGAPTLSEVDQDWLSWIGPDRLIVAYNADFDRNALRHTSLHGLQWMDAYRGAMHFWSIGDKNEDDFPLMSLQQQELRYWLNIPEVMGDAHRAAADIQVTAHLLSRMIDSYLECGYENSIEGFKQFINGPIIHRVFPIGGKPFKGKTPEEIDDWALKKALDPSSDWYESFKKFDIVDCLLPEYLSRFGSPPTSSMPQNKKLMLSRSKTMPPATHIPAPAKIQPSVQSSASRWKRT